MTSHPSAALADGSQAPAPVGSLLDSPAARAAAWFWPALLWFFSAFFLLGDLGRWHDDWFYIQRVPETGAVLSLVLDHEVHFWRPLYRVVVPTLATLLSEHARLHHLLVAAVHALNAWLLWWLLWRLGVRRLACGLSALLFLVFPWDGEVAFWLSCLPTGLSSAVMLGAMQLAVSCGRGRGGWWLAPASAALTFIACCLNEEPAMLFAALPGAYLCAVPGRITGRDALRAALPAVASGLAAGVYAVLHARHSPGAMNIGAAHGVLPLPQWPSSVAQVWTWLAGSVGSGDWLARAWHHAGKAIEAHPARSVAVIAGMAVAAAAWVGRMSRFGHERASARPGLAPSGPGRLALLGAAAASFPLVPIVAFSYWGSPRILYPSVLGLSILFAAFLTLIANRVRRPVRQRATLRAVFAGCGVAFLAALALGLLGVQEAFQSRDRLDRDLLRQLRELVPHPAPGSVLVPALVENPECPDAGRMFDEYFRCAMNSWWVAGWSVRLTYQRSDLDAGYADWGRSAWSVPAFDGARVQGVGRVPWDRIVPFEVDSRDQVRLITGVRFTNAAGEQRTIQVPQTAELAGRGLIPERWFVFEPPIR